MALFLPLALPLLASGATSLQAAALSTARPVECAASTPTGSAPSLWRLARQPALEGYCDHVARAQVLLPTDPEAAAREAQLAEAALPGRAAPRVIEARAALARGDVSAAVEGFEAARRLDARSLEEPSTLRDVARALRLAGRPIDAFAAYEALIPRLSLVAGSDRQVLVLLEAAHLAVSLERTRAAGPPDLGRALAYLREARQRSTTQYEGDVLLSLVLVLDRAGQRAVADATLAEAVSQAAEARYAASYLTDAADGHALAALASSHRDRRVAEAEWDAFLASPLGKGAWSDAARARRDTVATPGAARAELEAVRPAVLVVLPLLLGAGTADATDWSRARDPRKAKLEEVGERVEQLVMRYQERRREARLLPDDVFGTFTVAGERYLREARRLVEEAGGPGDDAQLALAYGDLLVELHAYPEAIAALQPVASSGEPVLRLEAWKDIAIAFAHLQQRPDEVAADERALALEPDPLGRALLLANQAEAYMSVGRIEEALAGYRSALVTLGTLPSPEFSSLSPTTFWGLAVALDRSGDPEQAFEAIRMARRFDPLDRKLQSSGWFFSPAYEEAYYSALGAWVSARDAVDPEDRARAYQAALGHLAEFVRIAGPSDPWVAVAKSRLRGCELEARRRGSLDVRKIVAPGR